MTTRTAMLIFAAVSLDAQQFLFRRDVVVPQQFGAGATAGPTFAGDFNGDGRPDLVLCNVQVVTVLLNTGGGNFRSVQSNIDTCGLAADTNGDGRADLINGNTLQLGVGDGTFLPPRTIPVNGQSPRPAVAGDFNGDRRTDLLFYSGPTGWTDEQPQLTMHLLLGGGDGVFSESWRLAHPPGRLFGAAITGDFNRDGNSDLAVNNGDGIAIFPGVGNGTFRQPVTTVNGEASNYLVAGDFNRDGIPDLASAASISLGKGDGSFHPPVRHPLADSRNEHGLPVSLLVSAAADFNNDGYLDLAGALFGLPPFIQNRVSVLPGRGDGTLLAPVHYAVGLWPQNVAAADFDADGRVDLAVAGSMSNTATVLLGRPAGPALNRAVSAASKTALVSAESLATLFGSNLAGTTAQAQPPWPESLGGVSLQVRDANGATRLAPLLYVSPGQINFQVPAGIALGEATLTVLDGRGSMAVGTMQVEGVAPGLFTVEGLLMPMPRPAALAVRIEPDGNQTNLPLLGCSPDQNCFPVALPEPDERPIYISLFGTGFRAAGPSRIACTADGAPLNIVYAGPQAIPGVDQINVALPRGRPGLGTIVCSINGVVANPLWL